MIITNPDFGLDREIFEKILGAIKSLPEISEAIIFGSRAMGNFKLASDIDIAIKGKTDFGTAAKLRAILEEATRFPYKVDVIDYGAISNLELKKHIDDFGKTIYKRRTSQN